MYDDGFNGSMPDINNNNNGIYCMQRAFGFNDGITNRESNLQYVIQFEFKTIYNTRYRTTKKT